MGAGGRILAKERGRTPLPPFQPPEVGGGLLALAAGRAVLHLLLGLVLSRAPTPQQEKVLGEWVKPGLGPVEGSVLKALGPNLLLCWGTTVPGWARLHKE